MTLGLWMVTVSLSVYFELVYCVPNLTVYSWSNIYPQPRAPDQVDIFIDEDERQSHGQYEFTTGYLYP